MDAAKTLNLLCEGQSARVRGISACGAVLRRFRDLGLINGTLVKCVLSGNGGMSAYLIRGALIAIRNEDAEKIII